MTCTAPDLVSSSECLECAMTHKQLLAALLYVQCTANGMNCTPSSLVSASECLRCAMTEKQLLAALVYIQCTNNGGGGGGGAPDFINYAGPPVDNPPTLAYIVVDVNYRQWQYGSSGWQ